MKLEKFLETLPNGIMSGDDVQLSQSSLYDIFDFIKLGKDDIFYHLGCGDGDGLGIATKIGVKKAIGIDKSSTKIAQAKKNHPNIEFICDDITKCDIKDATVILFWFTDKTIIQKMIPKFEQIDGCKIITLWGPLPGHMPDKVKFPYVMTQVPFKPANIKDQLLAVFGVKCVDFVTAWEHAEKYTKAIEMPDSQNNRFVTIIQTLVIWINAKNLGIACGDEIPKSVHTYIEILKNFYGIEVGHLLDV